jgi:hypothetical protein
VRVHRKDADEADRHEDGPEVDVIGQYGADGRTGEGLVPGEGFVVGLVPDSMRGPYAAANAERGA